MKQARFASLLAGQTEVARKVFDFVPLAEEWSLPQICAEMHRNGKTRGIAVVEACLDRLTNAGLVLEPRRGLFRRVAVHQPQPKHTEPAAAEQDHDMQQTASEDKQTTAAPTALDRITPLTARLVQLSHDLKRLATDIDTAALEIEADVQEQAKRMEKLNQLKTLLKEIQ